MLTLRHTVLVFVTMPLLAYAQTSTSSSTSSSSGGPYVADCAKLMSMKCDKDYKADPIDMHQCIMRGWDPPIGCLNNQGKSAGVKVSGASGSVMAAVSAPDQSPGQRGAPPSVGQSVINFTMGFPPWAGFPCQLPGGFNLCNSSKTSSSSSSGGTSSSSGGSTIGGCASTSSCPVPTGITNACPAAEDTTGVFGVTSCLCAASVPLVCGGAIPLSDHELTLNPNPTLQATTAYGQYFLWMYQRQGTKFAPTASALPLPTYLGNWDSKNNVCLNQVDLTAPIGQTILFDAATQTLKIRLIDGGTTPYTSPTPNPLAYAQEQFLIIPISGGVPQIPPDCSDPAVYLQTTSTMRADIVFEANSSTDCESLGQQCPVSITTPTAAASCDVVNIYNKGTVQTSAGTVDCSKKLQVAVLTRPNLIYPPGSTPSLTSVQGITSQLASTAQGSLVYLPQSTVIRLGSTAPAVILPEGGNVMMTDGSQLLMGAPSTINAGGGSVTMQNGGQHLAADGSQLKTYAVNSTVQLTNPVLPLLIQAGRSIQLPAGYLIPTQPAPYVRLPVDTP